MSESTTIKCPLGVGSKLLLPLYADVRSHIPMTHRNDRLGIRVVCGISEAQQGIYDIAAVQQVNKAYGLAFEVLPAFVGGGKKSVAADLRARQSFEEGISAPSTNDAY